MTLALARKVRNFSRALLQVYAPRTIKRYLWNSEFSRGRWDCLASTTGDCVYPIVERYAAHGTILDLGCGSGSTGNELDATAYREYVGVDISDVAIEKARERTEQNRRAETNRYLQSDIGDYVPAGQCDVILFRDSIYYVEVGKIKPMLDRYAGHLKPHGVFIVRIAGDMEKSRRELDVIERNFEIVERRRFDEPRALVIVFRSRPPSARDARNASPGAQR